MEYLKRKQRVSALTPLKDIISRPIRRFYRRLGHNAKIESFVYIFVYILPPLLFRLQTFHIISRHMSLIRDLHDGVSTYAHVFLPAQKLAFFVWLYYYTL